MSRCLPDPFGQTNGSATICTEKSKQDRCLAKPTPHQLADLVGTFLATVSVGPTMPTLICGRAAAVAVPFKYRGDRPKLGFMRELLASDSTTVFRYRGNVTPPRDYGQWAILIRALVEHWVRRDGGDKVSRRRTLIIQGLRRAGFTGGWL